MASTAEIQARLTLNAKNFTSSFNGAIDQATARARAGGAQVGQAFADTAGDGLRSFAGQVPVVGGALTGLNGVALGTAAAIGGIAVALTGAVSEAETYARATRGLEAVLKATGNQTGLTSAQLRAFADEQESALAIAAESIIDAEKALASFDGVAGTTFKRAITSAADLAAVYGGDLNSNAQKLGVVLQNLAEGNVEGLSKGFKFLGTTTLDTIAALAKAGDTAGAQVALLDALEQKIGGSGAAAGQGVAGAFFRLSDAVGDTSRAFAEQSGLYGAVVSGLDAAAAAATSYGEKLAGLNKLQLTGQAFGILSANFAPGVAIGRFAGGLFGGGAANDNAAGAAARDNILGLEAQRQKSDQDRAAASATARAKALGDAQRAADAAAESAKKGAVEQERAAKAAEAAARAVERQKEALAASIADLEFQAVAAGKTRDEAEKLSTLRRLELQFGKLLTANDRERVARAIELRQINEEGRALDEARIKALQDTPSLFDEIQGKQQAGYAAAATAERDLTLRREADFRFLSDAFFEVFSSRSGNIWNRFKELGARTLADLASQFVIGGRINLGGTAAGGLINGLLGGAPTGGSGLTGSLLGGGLAAGVGGLIGSAGLGAVTIGAGAASAAGVGALGGVTLAGAGAGASGLLGTLGSVAAAAGPAAPFIAAAAGLAALGYAVFGKKDDFSDAALVTAADGIAVAALRTRGKESAGKSEQLTGLVDTQLEQIAAALGGTIAPGIRGGSIGTNRNNFYFNPTGGDFKDAGRVIFSTPEEAAAAAVRDLVAKGALAGVDQSVTRLLATGDIASQLGKAQLLSAAIREFNTNADPTGEAIRTLNDQFAQLRDVMAEAGSSAEDVAKASALYDRKLQEIRDSAGGATTTLRAFLDDLGFGASSPLSLGDQAAAARAAYAAQVGRIGTSGFDQSAFVSSGQRLLDIEGQLNGRTQDFFAVFNQVQADTNRAIGAINNASGITGDNPFARATADATAATADNTALLLAETQAMNANLLEALGRFGIGGFIGGDGRGFAVA
jgi:hypothetical protein